MPRALRNISFAVTDARALAEILDQHVAMLPDGGGNEVAQRARPGSSGAAPAGLEAGVGELGVEGAGHLAPVLAAEYRCDLRAQWPSMNGLTSIGVPMARANFRPQPSAASRSGALRTVMPPICSLLSMNGPSVVTISPL